VTDQERRPYAANDHVKVAGRRGVVISDECSDASGKRRIAKVRYYDGMEAEAWVDASELELVKRSPDV
jgi:hypothetical protein